MGALATGRPAVGLGLAQNNKIINPTSVEMFTVKLGSLGCFFRAVLHCRDLRSTICSHSRVTPRPSACEAALLQKEPCSGRFGSTDLQRLGRALATVIDPEAHFTCSERSSLSRTILCKKAARVAPKCSLRKTTNSMFSIVALSSWHSMCTIGISKGW